MRSFIHFSAAARNRAVLLVMLLVTNVAAYSQCNCPPVTICGACQGGMTSLTFRYDDPATIPLPATVTVTDGGGIIFTGVVPDGGTFEVKAIDDGNLFVGNSITMSKLLWTETISTTCSAQITVGDSFGEFTVIAGASQNNLPICCAVEDMEKVPPTINNCPSNTTTSLSPLSCTKIVNWSPVSASDNCGAVTLTSSHSSGTAFPVGLTVVTYTATDKYGNTSTCSFTVQVNDITPPVLSACPSNITVNANATPGTCGTNVTWIPPSVSDNCTVTLGSTKTPGEFFSVGTTAVSYSATDAGGNQTTCSFNVVVIDQSSPVITGCPGTITVEANAATGSCGSNVTWTPPTVQDNCAVTLTSDKTPGQFFPGGITPVTYTATDASGRTATCTFNVVVNDITKPVITGCPSNISLNTSTCSAAVNWIAPTAADNCAATVTSNFSPGATFPVGVTPVTYTATDPAGNVETCTFTVTVRDNDLPSFTNCLNGIILEVAADNSCEAVATWTPLTAIDNCSVVVTSTHNPGDTFPIGKTDVVYTATDPSGNSRTCSFKVFVKDRSNPIITGCVSDITVPAAAGCGAVVNWIAPTATDNCEVELTSTHSPGETFPVGTTTVVYTATDPAGNFVQCSFNVIVNDTSVPTVTGCPGNISAPLTGTSCTTAVTWTPPAFSDNCAVTVTSNKSPGDIFPLGTTQVTYTATDPSGNTRTCSFTITVNDLSAPVISNCPANLTVAASANCNATATWPEPTFVDNCVTPAVVRSHAPGQLFALGETVVTYVATDGAGNQSICSFTVTVNDSSLPVIENCPTDISVVMNVGSCSKAVSWTVPTASDNCAVTLTSNYPPGHFFLEGTTGVIYTATDGSGNISTCSFNVTILDPIAPETSNCPADIEVSASASCSTQVSWTPPTFTDNCGAVTVTASHIPNDSFPSGTTSVTYTATDASGNSTICEFIVTVVDKTNPVITNCPSNITASASEGCAAVVSWSVPTATDNCQVELTSTHTPGVSFAIGTTRVTYTATDAAGNHSSCFFDVTVLDESKPIFASCPSDARVAAATSSCSAMATWTAPTLTDCSAYEVTSTHQPGATFSFGTTQVVYTARDLHGNRSTCSFNMIVEDKSAPIFANCLSDIAVNASTTCDAVVSWNEPVASDNCGIYSVTSSHHPGEIFQTGITKVIYTATDVNGNQSTCEFSVIVKNKNAPVFADCPSDQTINVIDRDFGVASWTEPTATTVCGDVEVKSSHLPGAEFPIGETVVEYVATDIAGNSTTCKFKITVEYEALDITIAKLITPDGDGINDGWMLENIGKFSDNQVTVFDRWGSVLYSAKGYNNQNTVWKGVSNGGVNVPTGTYFYTITVRYRGEYLERKGFIELVR